MIIIAGTVTIEPNKREEALQAARHMAQATQAEHGCIDYNFYADISNPNNLLVFEIWETEEALDRHFQTDHMKSFQQQLPSLLAGDMDIKRYNVESITSL